MHACWMASMLSHLDHELASEHLLKRGQVFLHAPDFDLAVMRCVDMQCHVLRIDNTQACALDEASMAAVQILRQAEQRTCELHNLLSALIESSECRGFFAWQGLVMIERRCRHNGNFCLIEAQEVSMPDEVGGVRLVIGIVQKRPNVMQHGSIFEQFAFPCPETVQTGVTCAVKQR